MAVALNNQNGGSYNAPPFHNPKVIGQNYIGLSLRAPEDFNLLEDIFCRIVNNLNGRNVMVPSIRTMRLEEPRCSEACFPG